jgi:hypothetical protein
VHVCSAVGIETQVQSETVTYAFSLASAALVVG